MDMEVDPPAQAVPPKLKIKGDPSPLADLQVIMGYFPLLASWKGNTYWTGFIQGGTRLVRIALSVPQFPYCAGATVHLDADGMQLLGSCATAMNDMILSNTPVLQFLQRVLVMINDTSKKEAMHSLEATTNPDFFLAIFNELDAIGTEVVEFASASFQELCLKYVDPLRRKHMIKFKIPLKYPQAGPHVVVDLPLISDKWPVGIAECYSKFKSDVNRYVQFWSVMDELDSQARVIDPIQPKRGDTHRRILLNQNVVVSLVFNPLCPKVLPEIKFSGPEKNIQDLEALLDQNCQEWTEENSILENLENIFRCEFMLKTDSDQEEEKDDIESACVICYAFEFEGNVPETTCECGSIYHEKCLSDLLVNDCSVKAKRFCVDCPACGLELKISKSHKVTW